MTNVASGTLPGVRRSWVNVPAGGHVSGVLWGEGPPEIVLLRDIGDNARGEAIRSFAPRARLIIGTGLGGLTALALRRHPARRARRGRSAATDSPGSEAAMTQAPEQTAHRVRTEPNQRRVRVFFGGETVADSAKTLYLFETGHLPVYYFPRAAVRFDLLEPTSHHSHCPYKGDASYYSVIAGGKRYENAVWAYPEPIDPVPELKDYVAFSWNQADAWYEEDDEVYEHPRDPYHRVDVLNSSRHVEVLVDGVLVAESRRPRLLFETGLPVRYYLPKLDVRLELLEPTATRTRCPYKGEAVYSSVRAGGQLHEDIGWSYPAPIPEAPKIENLIAFYNEKVDIVVDGVLQERPVTRWS